MQIKDTIIERLKEHLAVLMKEIDAGKKILHDPNLSKYVSRNLKTTLEGKDSP